MLLFFFDSYGDMFPITAIGRALTCLCALLGSSTMGMLTSVLVDRYQRVYNRKMYISEQDVPLADAETRSNIDDERRSNTSSIRLHRRAKLANTFNHSLTSLQSKKKNDRFQKAKLQFHVTFTEDTKDRYASDQVVKMMQKKLTEAISASDVHVNLKLFDHDNEELWTMSSSDALKRVNSEGIGLSHLIDRGEEKQQLKIVTF